MFESHSPEFSGSAQLIIFLKNHFLAELNDAKETR